MTKNEVVALTIALSQPGVLAIASFFDRNLFFSISLIISIGICVFLPVAIFTAIWSLAVGLGERSKAKAWNLLKPTWIWWALSFGSFFGWYWCYWLRN